MNKPHILVFEGEAATNHAIRVVLEAAGYGVSQLFDQLAARQALDAGPLEFALLAELQRLGQGQQSMLEASRSNRSIGTAVGMIMERHQLTPERAFEALRRQARNERVSMAHLSLRIVAGIVGLRPPLPAC